MEQERGEVPDCDQFSSVLSNTLQKRRKKKGEPVVFCDKSAKISHDEAVSKVYKFFASKFIGEEYDKEIGIDVRADLANALLGEKQPRKYLIKLYSEMAGIPLKN